MPLRKAIAAAAAFQLAGLLAVGWWFKEALNTDAVAYLRLAEYYAHGEFALAISGYWSPLLSWLLAPWLAWGCSPWLAARLVMAFSAIVFLAGCLRWFLVLPWPEDWKKIGIWTAALVSIPWSVANITPDLLLAGVLSFTFAALYRARQTENLRLSLMAGILAGVAYCAKAVALPVSLLVAGAWLTGILSPKDDIPRRRWGLWGTFILGLCLTVAPWVVVLSQHYGQLTLTRAATINHALAGPPDVDRYHPTFRTFHSPPPGRLTTWEDPSLMHYETWTPWHSPSLAWHQLKVILKNLALIQLLLTTLFLDWPVVLGWWLWRRRQRLPVFPPFPSHLLLAGWGIVALCVVYVPNYLRLGDQRYFYPALPLLVVAGVWMAEGFSRLLPDAERWLKKALPLSLLIPACALLFWWLPPKRTAGQLARVLAEDLRAANLRGETAGSALQPGGRTGLMVAYYLGLPWLGDQPQATAEDIRRSGAELFFVNRNDPLAKALAAHPQFREVPPLSPTTHALPVAVFRKLPAAANVP